MQVFRIAVAGFGTAARCQIEASQSLPGYEVVAVCTSRLEVEGPNIRSLCGKDVEIFSDYDEMLAKCEADIIGICTLHDVHAEQVIKAATAGKHIFLEKPICLKPEDLLPVRQTVKSAGIEVCVCFQEFHYGQFLTALELIDEGYLGEVHLAEVEYYNSLAPWVKQSWWAKTKALSGSSLLSGGCHGLLFLMLAMGRTPVAEVSAYSTRSKSAFFEDMEFDGTQLNILKFTDGRVGKISAVADSVQPYIFKFSLIGSEGTLIDRQLNSRKLKGLDPTMWTSLGTRDISDGAAIGGYMYVNMMRNFHDHLVTGVPFKNTDFDTIFEMHRVMFAADQSASTGKPVKLDGFLEPTP